MAEQNAGFDLIKVWVTDEGTLAYGATAVIEGWPRENFRNSFDLVRDSSIRLGQQARAAKLDGSD
ncbi:hypothetical protein [Sphingomonas sp.]|uniref:hypothetical protein n=1 Tax=Sphingomonas sp. TaxID=28214 RepID=UPI001B2B3DCA|nr:hypothetical protein [Sphingomonas sp.]MBO9713040.1 hypothetical protein [Sphingomonas sp.]